MYNIAISAGEPVKVVDTALATGTAYSTPFSPKINPGQSFAQLKIDAVITGAATPKAKLETRPNDSVAWTDFTPSDSIDLGAIPSQLLAIGPGQYRFNITTFGTTSLDIYVSLG